HEQCIGQCGHVADAAEAAQQLVHLAAQHLRLFLAAAVERTALRHLVELVETLDRLSDGLEICEHAPQPTLVDVRHTASRGLFLDRVARRSLGADEKYLAPFGGNTPNEGGRMCIKRLGLLEINDMNFVAFAEDKRSHLRVPEAG